MARINVYLPDDLATAVNAAQLPVSRICQKALSQEVRKLEVKHEATFDPDQVAARIKQSEETTFAEGRTLGVRWAADIATRNELERIAHLKDWLKGKGRSCLLPEHHSLVAFLEAERVPGAIEHEFERAPDEQNDVLVNRSTTVAGVITGAIEVWEAVKDQLS
jgi:Post-segregation antitoxin CcdA